MKRTVLGSAFIFLIVLLSCEAPFDFDESEDRSVSLEIETVQSGQFVSPGASVPVGISILAGAAELVRADFRLILPRGEAVASQSIQLEGMDLDSIPDLGIPDVLPGMYVLETTVYGAEEEVLEESTVRFFVVSGSYSVRRVSTFPAAVEPKSEILLLAELDFPETAGSYIVWRMGDSVIYEGAAESDEVKVRWRAPEIEGVYSLEAELFPSAPDTIDGFHSPVRVPTEVYVSKTAAAGQNDFGEESRFSSLFHFRGNYNDSGYGSGPDSVKEFGNPNFDVRNNLYGLNLDGGSGLVMEEIDLPDFGEAPFSLLMRMIHDTGNTEATLLEFTGPSGGEVFILETDEEGMLRGRFNAGGLPVIIPSGISLNGPPEPVHIALSVYPAEDGSLDWYWYRGGMPTGTVTTPDVPRGPITSLVIGGENGLTGIIDELGFYTMNEHNESAALENVFAASIRKRYGNGVRYAEGFRPGSVPEDLEVEGQIEFSLDGAVVFPDGALTLPGIEYGNEKLSLGLLVAENSGEADIQLSSADGETVSLSLDSNGHIIDLEGNRHQLRRDSYGYIWIDLDSGDDGLRLETQDGPVLLFPDSGGRGTLFFRVGNPAGETGLILRAVIVLSERGELVYSPSGGSRTIS